MSALQKQLAAIAATSTHQLDLKAQKAAHGKSLLFEPRVAASQSFESIYLLCHEGFRDLCALDHRFVPFAKTIFSEQSKVEDRTQMTKAENAKLDSVLQAFLTLVSSRILLKPAEKAVEWLVRRFRIHEYNTELLVLAYLPYHTTPQFLALLSILPVQSTPALRFLQPYISSPTNPPRQTIVYTAVNTPSFFASLQEFVVKVLQANHQGSTLLSFWAGITTQAVDAILDQSASGRKAIQDQRTEELLLKVLPALNACLRINGASEATMGCYMIIIVLVTKGSFEDKVLDALMEAVVRSLQPDILEGSLMCLSVIAEERSHSTLPPAVAKRLLRVPDLSRNLGELQNRCRVERLALACAVGALESISRDDHAEESRKLYLDIVQARLLNKEYMLLTLSLLLKLTQDARIGSPQYSQILEVVTQLSEIEQWAGVVHPFIEANKSDFRSLGMSLGQTIQSTDNVDIDPEDEEMLDADDSTEDASAAVSPPDIAVTSFLDAQASDIFQATLTAFEQTTSSYRKAMEFLSSIQSGSDSVRKPLLLSFLCRTWCSHASIPTKVTAIRAAGAVIKEHGAAVDLQNVIPYLICAFTDPSPAVRRAAATCTSILAKTVIEAEKQSQYQVWAASGLYAQRSSKVSTLAKGQTSLVLLSTLLPVLEECVMDNHFVIISIRGILEGTQSTKTGSSHSLKVPVRMALASFLSSHLAVTPVMRLRVPLLPLFLSQGKAINHVRTAVIVPLVRQWLSLPVEEVSSLCRREHLDIERVDQAHLDALMAREVESVDLLKEVISGTLKQEREQVVAAAFTQLNMFWPSMKPEPRLDLAQCLLDLALNKNTNLRPEIGSQARALETLRTVNLDSDVLLTFLENIPSALQMPEGPPTKKRRRSSRNEMARVELQSPHDVHKLVQRLTLVLELIEGSDPGQHPVLFKNLFTILGDLQQLKQQSGSDLVYLQSLILSSLTPMVNHIKQSKQASTDAQAAVRADLLIDCIRHSSNPQVQNAALLLIASLASWVPELVLHNLMPIFTFIGSTLLRQQDDYSIHVVDQTISRVVPQLAASLKAKHKDFLTGVADLLLSFTAAFEHIPSHRRLRLFSELAQTLGPEDSLSAIIALLVDRYPASKTQRKFVPELLLSFKPSITLDAFKGYLELIVDAVGTKRKVADSLFSLNERQPAQVESATNNLLSFLADLAANDALRNHIGKAFRKTSNLEQPRATFARIVETTVQLSKQVPGHSRLYASCTRVLASCLDLLPTADLVKSAELLLANTDQQVQVAAIKSVEVRTSVVTQNDQQAVSSLLSFLPNANQQLAKTKQVDVKIIAISCIDRIVERFGKKDAAAVEAVASTIAGAHSLASKDDRVRMLSLICLTSVVDVLGEEFIPLLPAVLPTAFKYLHESIEGEKPGLHNAVFTLLSDIVERLSFMFSREYIVSSLELAHRSASTDLEESCDESRQRFYEVIAKHIDAKEAFAAYKQTWPSAIARGFEASNEHLAIMQQTIEAQSKSKLVNTSSALFSLLVEIFDVRHALGAAIKDGSVNEDELEQLEGSLINSVITMVSKLNDATFRPFFVQLVEWATSSKAQANASRSITFYKFLAEFFEHFKSIVTSYSSYILDHAASLLTHLSTAVDPISATLRSPLLTALQSSFHHDTSTFWATPSHYASILSPLLSQLALAPPPTSPLAPDMTSHVIPTITALATSATSSLDLHREMNTILLKYMRAEEAHTRLAVVKQQISLTERLGEEWLTLLPEMLPFISELREDDDEAVEREVVKWISGMEGILGESLEGMLQ